MCSFYVSRKTHGNDHGRAIGQLLLGIIPWGMAISIAGCSSSATPVDTCEASFEGTPWVPSVTGAGSCNHNDTGASDGVQIAKWTYSAPSSLITGLGNAIAGRIITVSNIPVTDDLLLVLK